jgi:F0F1-type ATP synthase membrane subunit b/b'
LPPVGATREVCVLAPNLSLLFVMACFWLVYLLVSSQFVKPLGAVLDEREKRSREARAAFDQAEQALTAAIEKCERQLAAAAAEGQKERTLLRAAGEATRRARLDEARDQTQQHIVELKRQLAGASDQARAQLRSRTGQLARELASRVLGRSVA